MTSPFDVGSRVIIVMRTRNRRVLLERAIAESSHSRIPMVLTIVTTTEVIGSRVDAVVGRYESELGKRVAVIHSTASTGMEAVNAGIRSARRSSSPFTTTTIPGAPAFCVAHGTNGCRTSRGCRGRAHGDRLGWKL